MKKYILLLTFSVFAFASCKDDELAVPELSVTVDTENATGNEAGVPVFKAGSSVRFNFQGSADMVTFYSGEPGMTYQHRDRTKLEGLPYLQFNTQIEGGAIASGFLSVLVSTDFAGFTKVRATDAEHITKATWSDLTNQCNLPTIITTQLSPKVDLSAYAGKPVYVAFRYARPINTDFARYQIKNFRVRNEADGTVYEIKTTGNAGWTAFDFNTPASGDAYLATGGAAANRIWDFRNAAADDRINIGYNSQIASNDWAITSAIDLTSVSPDLGRGIKSYSDDRLNEYQYVFNAAGTYTVSFIASNSRYSKTNSSVKQVKVKVIN